MAWVLALHAVRTAEKSLSSSRIICRLGGRISCGERMSCNLGGRISCRERMSCSQEGRMSLGGRMLCGRRMSCNCGGRICGERMSCTLGGRISCGERMSCSCGGRMLRTSPSHRISRKWKSSVAILTSSGQTRDDGVGDRKGQTDTSLTPTQEQSNNVKIILIEKSSKAGTLESSEAPLLHHAKEGAVVDVQRRHLNHTTPTTTTSTTTTTPTTGAATTTPNTSIQTPASDLQQEFVEVQLPVDKLLKDSSKLVQRTRLLKPPEEDVEYVEELVDQKKAKTELVGALPHGALDWKPQRIEIGKLGSCYADLAKSRLTGLVVLTAMAGYAMAPAPLDPLTLVLCSLGTGLTSSAANAINQFFEVPYDAQMDRTKTRVLVRGLISPLHAVCFAGVCGTAGIGLLYFGANSLAAGLGAVTLLLYTCAYTPMKRLSIVNTWVGAIVGAIPPLIGWASCTGELEAGAWVMAGVLYAWQFPHFNSLSWNLRPDYSRAGYRMMSVTNPGLCRRVALRYSIGLIGLCTLAPVIDVTTWTFAADSLPVNAYLTYLAWRFYKDGDSNSSRKLFFFTLIHLPAIMMMMIISKKHYLKKKKEGVS